jgi:hypothetical protein
VILDNKSQIIEFAHPDCCVREERTSTGSASQASREKPRAYKKKKEVTDGIQQVRHGTQAKTETATS